MKKLKTLLAVVMLVSFGYISEATGITMRNIHMTFYDGVLINVWCEGVGGPCLPEITVTPNK